MAHFWAQIETLCFDDHLTSNVVNICQTVETDDRPEVLLSSPESKAVEELGTI